jgi:hypothetical protein
MEANTFWAKESSDDTMLPLEVVTVLRIDTGGRYKDIKHRRLVAP